MRRILVLGAGKSTAILIKYFQDHADKENLYITIADISIQAAIKLAKDHPKSQPIELDIYDSSSCNELIENNDIIVSMLPASLHKLVAKFCLNHNKHLVTASYISKELKALDKELKHKDLIFMNEVGLDPGIDHMSAMKVIDQIKSDGGKITSFESFTGGLVSPLSHDHIWNYKFTWNPRNVVLAGQGQAAKFLSHGDLKYIPYHRLFKSATPVDIPSLGMYEVYPNRNSLTYKEIYGLSNVSTLYRGTIREKGFSRAWNLLIQLGMTADDYVMDDSENMTYRDFTNSFLPFSQDKSVESKLRSFLNLDQDDAIWKKLMALDLCNPNKKVGLSNATPAQMLQQILMDTWSLNASDKDMIIMYHKFEYEQLGKKMIIDSVMTCTGEDTINTAMAKTVGLPVAITTLKILNNEINRTGVLLPVYKEIYEPILKELEEYGIHFEERLV